MQAADRIAIGRGLIGTPFRLHGRNPEIGLDCVGLVAFVFDRVGETPTGYALRNCDLGRWLGMIGTMARRRSALSPEPADIVMMTAGPAQFHLGIWTGDGLLHADASLRRVVETPGAIRFPILACWQFLEG